MDIETKDGTPESIAEAVAASGIQGAESKAEALANMENAEASEEEPVKDDGPQIGYLSHDCYALTEAWASIVETAAFLRDAGFSTRLKLGEAVVLDLSAKDLSDPKADFG